MKEVGFYIFLTIAGILGAIKISDWALADKQPPPVVEITPTPIKVKCNVNGVDYGVVFREECRAIAKHIKASPSPTPQVQVQNKIKCQIFDDVYYYSKEECTYWQNYWYGKASQIQTNALAPSDLHLPEYNWDFLIDSTMPVWNPPDTEPYPTYSYEPIEPINPAQAQPTPECGSLNKICP